MDDGDRATPVALARHQPIAQTIVYGSFALVGFSQPVDHGALAGLNIHAVEEVRIRQLPVVGKGIVADIERLGVGVVGYDDRQDGEIIRVGEIEIALIMGRAAEDGAGPISHQHEIRDVDRQFNASRERVLDAEAGVVAALFGGLDGFFAGAELAALFDESCGRAVRARDVFGQWVIGRNGAKTRAEDCVRSRCVDPQRGITTIGEGEIDMGAFGTTDPVFLHRADLGRPPVESFQRGQELVAEGRDPAEPLGQAPAFDRRARTPALPVDHLFVCQNRIVDRVPVHPAILSVDEILGEEIDKHRLLVPVVGRVAGRELPVPIDRKSHRLELSAHGGNVFIGP